MSPRANPFDSPLCHVISSESDESRNLALQHGSLRAGSVSRGVYQARFLDSGDDALTRNDGTQRMMAAIWPAKLARTQAPSSIGFRDGPWA